MFGRRKLRWRDKEDLRHGKEDLSPSAAPRRDMSGMREERRKVVEKEEGR